MIPRSAPLRRHAPRLLVAGCALAFAACKPPAVPGPEDGASYLGLGKGKTLTYDLGGSLSETHEMKESSLLVEGRLVFDVLARQNGFAVEERTLTLAVGVEDVQIVRFFDCITRCGQPAEPIPFLALPLDEGQQSEIEVDIALSRNGADEGTVTEKHLFIVGAASDVTVPAGTFPAHTVSWTRTVDGQSESAVLRISPAGVPPGGFAQARDGDEPPAPGAGIVSWDGFDGSQLRLAGG